jgi:hypothetical protein
LPYAYDEEQDKMLVKTEMDLIRMGLEKQMAKDIAHKVSLIRILSSLTRGGILRVVQGGRVFGIKL